MPCVPFKVGDSVGILTLGGPFHRISVRGKIVHFEMHPWCGPMATDADGNELRHQPRGFLHAASQWAQQGQQIGEDGLCIWHEDPEPILERRGRRNYVVGYKSPVRGH